jgi:hypothetical protein
MKLRDSGRDDVLLFVIPSLFVIPEGNLRSAQITEDYIWRRTALGKV